MNRGEISVVTALRVILAGWLLAGSVSILQARPPSWFTAAVDAPVGSYASDVPAVILHDEGSYDVKGDGKISETTYYAVRVLNRDGGEFARAEVYYNSGTGTVKDFKAWLVSPSGKVKTFKKGDYFDVVGDADALFSESRRVVLSASGEAEPGSVFGFQCTIEKKTVFTQFRWMFQSSVPVVFSRVGFTVPDDWSVTPRFFNHDPVEPVILKNTYVWELENLPGIPEETMCPSWMRVSASVGVKLDPPDSGRKRTKTRSFNSWNGISDYLHELHEPQAAIDEKIRAKTLELIANAPDEWSKLSAIASYAQDVRYVSISMELDHGGGYRPRSAAEVLATGYGDCKDKTTLMRSMLDVADIESYPVCTFLGDRSAVLGDWPSLGQFNHCIIAVRVSSEVNAPAVVDDPNFGRILIFDPTDPSTPFGDVRYDHQGSLGLVVAPESGGIVRMPVMAPELNLMERTVNAVLHADGFLEGVITEQSRGQEASRERRLFNSLGRDSFDKRISRWIERGTGVSTVSEIKVTDSREAGQFVLETAFEAPGYAKSMRGVILVFKPVIVERMASTELIGTERQLPIVMRPVSYHERSEFLLPENFRVDESPPGITLVEDFGRYESTSEVVDGRLVFERSLRFEPVDVPASRYLEVKSFFKAIIDNETSPVVLERL